MARELELSFAGLHVVDAHRLPHSWVVVLLEDEDGREAGSLVRPAYWCEADERRWVAPEYTPGDPPPPRAELTPRTHLIADTVEQCLGPSPLTPTEIIQPQHLIPPTPRLWRRAVSAMMAAPSAIRRFLTTRRSPK